jgi:HEAT repeat protein
MPLIDRFERWFSRSDKSTNRADWKARCRELTRLGPVVDADAAAKLSAGFKDRDPRVQAAAGEALHKLGGARAISQLRCREIDALAAGDHATALARLREELRDQQQWPWPDVDARLAAVAALERIPGADVINLLTFAAREPISLDRLSRRHGTPMDYEERLAKAHSQDEAVSNAAMQALALRGESGIEVLLELAASEPPSAAQSSAATISLERAGHSSAVKIRAATALARAGHKRGFTLLIELLRDSKEYAAQQLIALAPASVERLLALLAGNRPLADWIIPVLGRIADVRAVPALVKLARDQKTGEACVAALQQILERNVTHASTEQLNAIAQMGTVRQLRSVGTLYDDDGKPYPHHLQEQGWETVTVDTQPVKALATAELHRRSSS